MRVSVSECLCVFQAAGDHNEMPTVHRISLYCVTPDNSGQKGTLRYYRGQLAWGRTDMGRNGEGRIGTSPAYERVATKVSARAREKLSTILLSREGGGATQYLLKAPDKPARGELRLN